MKKLSIKILTIVLLLSSICFYSCTKEAGPKGDPGAPGAPGVDGNANVTQIGFGSKTFTGTGATISLTLPGITKSIAEKSMILSYGKTSGSVPGTTAYWYQLPGYGYSAIREYRTFLESKDPASILNIRMETGPTPSSPETFEAIRVLVIPASALVTGRGAVPYDISDYESMRAYFKLP